MSISDVVVSEWNGMPDSARSLQVDDQDIVLMANGTDRFSGKVGGLDDGKIALDGKYGRFQFPARRRRGDPLRPQPPAPRKANPPPDNRDRPPQPARPGLRPAALRRRVVRPHLKPGLRRTRISPWNPPSCSISNLPTISSMTGMRISNLRPRSALRPRVGALGTASADELTLAATPGSPAPCARSTRPASSNWPPRSRRSRCCSRPERSRKWNSAPRSPRRLHPARLIELVNGDLLPADDRKPRRQESDRHLRRMPDAWRSRATALKSMQLGVHKRKVIYSGPESRGGMEPRVDGSKNWNFADGIARRERPGHRLPKIRNCRSSSSSSSP